MDVREKNVEDLILIQQKLIDNVQKNLSELVDNFHSDNRLNLRLNKKIKQSVKSIEKKLTSQQEKWKRVPLTFVKVFDQEGYLRVNPDVKAAIEDEKFLSALEHFILFGYEEVKNGKRQVGIVFPLFNEKDYLKLHPKVAKHIAEGQCPSAFEHFLEEGYVGFLNGKVRLGGRYPKGWGASARSSFQKVFNADAYLSANPDVAEAIEKGAFKSAWEHFEVYGADEVRRAKRQLYPNVPKLYESDYVMKNAKVFQGLYKEEIKSVFRHFLLQGVPEYLKS